MDADALDRWRIYDFDSRFLRTKLALTLLDASRELWSLTQDMTGGEEAVEQVVAAAIKIGILCVK